MAREAIIDLKTKKVVNIHNAWECPQGFLSIPSEDAEIGDDYVAKKIVMSAERAAEKAEQDSKGAQNVQEIADRKAVIQEKLFNLNIKKEKLVIAINEIKNVETLSVDQEAQLVAFEESLESVDAKIAMFAAQVEEE